MYIFTVYINNDRFNISSIVLQLIYKLKYLFISRTTSLQSQLDEYMGVNIQLEVDEHDLSFGESVLKCLEEEGILMFDIDNPQSGRCVYII